MIRIGILGGTGYTALELMKLLLRHPQAKIEAITSRQEDRPHVSAVHPQLTGRLDLQFENANLQSLADRTDCVFCCLPHAASASSVKALLEAGSRVVDFSADYRLNDVATYETWYKEKHPDAARVGSVVYGLPELFGDQIAGADLVANPGCFPTGAILPLAPFVQANLIDAADIIIDSKTGVSGAGRTPKLPFHYPECNESITAYGVGVHRHMPEIDQILKRSTGNEVSVIFTPHLAPMDRGILSTIYTRPLKELTQQNALEVLHEYYAEAPFVRVVEHLPKTKDTSHTNYCDITARVVKGRLLLISSIDNLVKGASGAAVQNFNIMFGFDETTAL